MEFSMEFHGKFFMKKNPSNVYAKFHGIPLISMKMSIEFHGILHGIPWNYMKLRLMELREFTEFHGIRCRQGKVLSGCDTCLRKGQSNIAKRYQHSQ
jgi:hypothetical protein